jgi:hypothetical protein
VKKYKQPAHTPGGPSRLRSWSGQVETDFQGRLRFRIDNRPGDEPVCHRHTSQCGSQRRGTCMGCRADVRPREQRQHLARVDTQTACVSRDLRAFPSSRCEACPADTYTDQHNTSECVPCLAGDSHDSTQSHNVTACLCDPCVTGPDGDRVWRASWQNKGRLGAWGGGMRGLWREPALWRCGSRVPLLPREFLLPRMDASRGPYVDRMPST